MRETEFKDFKPEAGKRDTQNETLNMYGRHTTLCRLTGSCNSPSAVLLHGKPYFKMETLRKKSPTCSIWHMGVSLWLSPWAQNRPVNIEWWRKDQHRHIMIMMMMSMMKHLEGCFRPHMGNNRPAGRMRPSTSLDPALIHSSELTHEGEIR
jgi:hypothetical protein